jgi:GTP cyclohydrolase I
MSEPVGKAVGLERKRGFDAARFESAVGDMLAACGFSADSDHLKNTAQRVRHLWSERLLDGYDSDPGLALGAGFADDRRDMVIVRNIAVRGVCPHHLLPFRGIAHVGYLPDGHLHGFGRIARMVDAISHRLTCQEWVTHDIAQALISHGKARGGACWIEAEQLCLLIGEDRRGEERVITQSFSGAFEADAQARSEFLQAVLSGR